METDNHDALFIILYAVIHKLFRLKCNAKCTVVIIVRNYCYINAVRQPCWYSAVAANAGLQQPSAFHVIDGNHLCALDSVCYMTVTCGDLYGSFFFNRA